MLSLPATHSIVSGTALAEAVAQRYSLAPIRSCSLLERHMHDTYLVLTDGPRYILRLYRHGVRSAEEIGYELDLLAHLSARGVSVAAALVDRDGRRVHAVDAPEGRRDFALFRLAPGAPPPLTPAAMRLYGRALAELHSAGDGFASPHRRAAVDFGLLARRTLARLECWLVRVPADALFMARLVDELPAALAMLSRRGLATGVCHGDCHEANAHLADGRLTFFDFDLCGPGWQAFDLAVMRDRVHQTGAAIAVWDAFVDGYRTARPLDGAALGAVPWLVIARNFLVADGVLEHAATWGLGFHFADGGYAADLVRSLRGWSARMRLFERRH